MFETIVKRTVRPEPVEGQRWINTDKAKTHLEACCYMLRLAQHERFPAYFSPKNDTHLQTKLKLSIESLAARK